MVLLLLTPGLGAVPLPGYLFALLFGFGTGGMSACYSALAGDSFKGPTFGVIMGFIEISYAMGGVVGPSLAGIAFGLLTVWTGNLLAAIVGHVLFNMVNLYRLAKEA